ncbi:hypothetical protein H0H81_011366 [Sphagnurus paluster]|uniref:Uncharacterized protein n=1 Tax=Sphagnurus paluster TaxID=117069 RepID=A0A9P7GPF7_9AGAR|nr:hypothetical protein H0H81_011366 [Sphagnurus paluster]
MYGKRRHSDLDSVPEEKRARYMKLQERLCSLFRRMPAMDETWSFADINPFLIVFYNIVYEIGLRDDLEEEKALPNLPEASKKEIVRAFANFIASKDLGPIINLLSPRRDTKSPEARPTPTEQEKAIELSWKCDFVGDAKDALMTHVRRYYEATALYYGRFLPIVQSSGMGKSRLVDELGKTYFTIPINLREGNSKGYPPPDIDLREFLLHYVPQNPKDVERYLFFFMVSLFETTYVVLQEKLQRCDGYVDTASNFRLLLTEGQTVGEANAERTLFFVQVINRTRDLFRNRNLVSTGEEMNLAAAKLVQALDRRMTPDEKNEWKMTPVCMESQKIRDDGRTTLEDVSKVEFMANFGRPLFGSRLQASNDIQELLMFAKIKLLGGDFRMNMRYSPANELACLSRRFPINFKSTLTSLEVEARQVESHLRVCLEVYDGFHGMMTVSPSEPVLSEAAAHLISTNKLSSPTLLWDIVNNFSVNQGDRGEFLCMQLLIQARDDVVYSKNRLSASESEEDALSSPESEEDRMSTSESEEDELSASESEEDRLSTSESSFDDADHYHTPLMFSVTQFFKSLFHADITGDLPSRAHPKHRAQTFGQLFATAKMNFNHFVEVHELAAESLIPAAVRSAGLLCANRNLGIDGLMVFTYSDTRLHPSNVGFVLWQSQNDPGFSAHTLQRRLFDAMDPFELNLLSPEDEPLPIIRIIFALAADEEPRLINMKEEVEDLGSRFTTFDYWCAGIRSSVFKPVIEEDQDIWNNLLAASRPWQRTYSVEDNRAASQLRRAANPLAAAEASFHNSWFDFGNILVEEKE